MPIYMISRVMQKNKLTGIGLLDDKSNRYKVVSLQSVIQALKSNRFPIENLMLDRGELKGSNGSLARYPIVDVNGSLRDNNSVIILNELTEREKTIGYTISDYKGTILKVKSQDLIKYIKTKGVANGKLVYRDGNEFISSITGEYKKIDISRLKRDTKDDNKNGSINISKKENRPITGEIKVDDTKITEEKITKKTATNVANKTYDPDMSLSRSITCDNGMTVEQKLVRSVLAMKDTHAFYFALYSLLNRIESEELQTMGVTSTELYYNPKFVASLKEAELNFINLHEVCHVAMIHAVRGKGKNHTIFNVACDYYINKVLCEEFGLMPGKIEVVNGVSIQCPEDLVYSRNVDIVKDTPEIIYEELMQSIEKKNPRFLSGITRCTSDDSNGCNADGNSESEVECDFRGDKIKIKRVYRDLIIDDKGDKSKEAHQGKALVERARLKSRGIGGCKLERLVEEILAPKVDWKRLFRNQLRELNIQITTFSNPDRRYIGKGMCMPGAKKLETEKLKGVKICIDTSGSMSSREIGECFTQVKDLLKTFELDAEVIYWDSEIENKDNFKNIKEFRAIKPKGGGGTDPSCVFKYFESEECKDKPSAIIMFTDGGFGEVMVSSKKKYKDTIWVIKNNKKFKAPFGKVAPLKIEI